MPKGNRYSTTHATNASFRFQPALEGENSKRRRNKPETAHKHARRHKRSRSSFATHQEQKKKKTQKRRDRNARTSRLRREGSSGDRAYRNRRSSAADRGQSSSEGEKILAVGAAARFRGSVHATRRGPMLLFTLSFQKREATRILRWNPTEVKNKNKKGEEKH